ncbi:MAG: Na+:H+ dicarboxylate symporter [Gammaproteobacteria bacterium]|nr:Na+:H+ dicarboxylate symporter [Gammaproteobacteria bacterium]
MLYNPLRAWLSLAVWQQIIIALAAGVICGLTFGSRATVLEPLGVLFIHAIQMMVVPVVFTAIICAVISVDELKSMRRLTLKAFLLYVVCMVVATCLGIVVALWVKPGLGFHLTTALTHAEPLGAAPTFSETILGFIPSNPLKAFTEGNIIQILIFGLILGVSIKLAGEPAKPVETFFKAFSSVVFKFAQIIVSFAPYGIFGLIATVFGQYGLTALMPLLKFIGTVYLACLLQCVVVYTFLLVSFRINPWTFLRGIVDAIVLAYTTSSSVATLPVTLRCARENLNLDRSTSGFLLPLGTSFNLNGLSIYLSVATIFAANIFGVTLHLPQFLMIVFSVVVSAMGAAAVPGSALIVMGAVMSSVGIPLGALALIAGVDRFNDMAQTATSVIGDLVTTTVIAKTEEKHQAINTADLSHQNAP